MPLKAEDKQEVLSEMVEFLLSAGKIENPEEVLKALVEREALSSTGLGKGIAIPHAKIPGLSDFVVAMGISPAGVEFDALDGEVSKLFFVLLAPPEQASLHMEALSEIAMMSMQEGFVDRLVTAGSPEAVLNLLT